MDIEVARTFLEVARSGSFVSAARALNMSQTAVGARIRVLEERMERPLFIRNKSGARLTPAGEQFVRYAASLVQLWETACDAVALPPGRAAVITLGTELSLWSPLLQDWLLWMREQHPEFAVRTVLDSSERLIRHVQEGAINAAVVYGAPGQAGLVNELLFEERLVLARTVLLPTECDMIGIDWGEHVAASIRAAFPEMTPPAVAVSYGPLALDYILKVGGRAYFREGFIRPQIEGGLLEVVPEAPVFPYPAYLVSTVKTDTATTAVIRAGLRSVTRTGRS